MNFVCNNRALKSLIYHNLTSVGPPFSTPPPHVYNQLDINKFATAYNNVTSFFEIMHKESSFIIWRIESIEYNQRFQNVFVQ